MQNAEEARDETESLLKYQACVANMPLNNLNQMDAQMIERITGSAVPIGKMHFVSLTKYDFYDKVSQLIPRLMTEVSQVYYKA